MSTHEVQSPERAEAVQTGSEKPRVQYLPDTDIFDQEGTVTLVCNMPGVNRENVHLEVEHDVLTLTGRAVAEEYPEAYRLLHRGFTPGEFHRSFRISGEVDRDAIQASMKDGVLTVTLPRAEQSQPRKIPVSS